MSIFTDYGLHPETLDQKIIALKSIRNRLLAECDWTQLPDAILTDAERIAWQDYRQALRDMPQDYVNPDLAILPSRPQ